MEIVSTLGVNGAVVHGTMVARELAQRGHEVIFVCLPNAWCKKQLNHEPVAIVPSNLRRWPLGEVIRIGKFALEKGVQVIHSHCSLANFFGLGLSWLTGIPSVATAQTHCLQLNWMLHDRIMAASHATKHFQRTYNLVRPSKIDVVHNFVDTERFSQVSAVSEGRIRSHLELDSQTLVLGVVGDIVPRKGLIYLIRALRHIQREVYNIRLLVVGDGPDGYTRKVKAEADRLGVSSCIQWIGHCSNIPEILKSLDLFVLPTLKESFPLSVLEAMSPGLPVVSTHVAGLPECVIPNKTGILVPPANPEALSKAVVRVLKDKALRNRLGESGRKRVRDYFSIEGQIPMIETSLQAAFSRTKKKRNPLSIL